MIKLKKSILKGTLESIPAKAHAHRVLICAALADRPTIIKLSWFSEDILATLNSLKALGASWQKISEGLMITPILQRQMNGKILAKESGTTLRLLLPVACAVADTTFVYGEGRLPNRPLEPLISEMKRMGVSFSKDKIPFQMQGRLKPGQYFLPGNVSSQFFSGLLLAAPVMGGIEVQSIGLLESAGYVDLTLDVMRQFQIEAQKKDGYFYVSEQKYHSPGQMNIEGDWSNAAPWFIAAAVTGAPIRITGLNTSSQQRDKEIRDILEQSGSEVVSDEKGILVQGKASKTLYVDMRQIPDLLPILAILACSIKGKSTFYNAQRLKIKESDRLETTAALIKNLGGEAIAYDDRLEVFGKGSLKGGDTAGFKDHRLVMAATIASLFSENPVNISGEEAINKSYPTFFDDWKYLGGECDVI